MPNLTVDQWANSKVLMIMVKIFTIDRGVNSRVSWPWSLSYPPLQFSENHPQLTILKPMFELSLFRLESIERFETLAP